MFRQMLKAPLLTTTRTTLLNASTIRTTASYISKSVPIYKPQIPTLDLDQVGGYIAEKNMLADTVRYLQDPKAFIKAGIYPPKGVLLSGEPGVGKTMIAEAVAGHSGVPIIITSASEMLDKLVGGAEEKLRNLFDTAAQNAPCVLLIDEIDSIAGERFASPKNSSERHQNALANQLLSLLSKNMPGVVVIATTNYADSLDKAVTRPGRFDLHIAMSLPGKNDRLEILSLYLKNKNLAPEVKLNELAVISSKFSGAKLASWVNQAAMLALRERSKVITLHHFDQARSIIQRGSLGCRISSEEQRLKTAQHEIGHALIGHLSGLELYKVSILKSGNIKGVAEFIPDENDDGLTEKSAMDSICRSLAGRAAEQVFGSAQPGSSFDLEHARNMATYLVRDEGMGSTLSGVEVTEDVELLLQEGMERARNLLVKNTVVFHKLVAALMHENELYAKDFLSVIDGTYVPSMKASATMGVVEKSILPKKKQQQITQTTVYETKSKSEPIRPVRVYDRGFFNNKPGQNTKKESDSNQKSGPFSIYKIATVIGVHPNEIRSVGFDGSALGRYQIIFKPSFNKWDYIKNEICSRLTENVINHFYLTGSTSILIIEPEGMADFIRLVNNANRPGFSP